jgi:DNA-binding LytR/AlgR family response regulator
MVDIKCLVVDDEPLAARLIGSYVERTPFLSLVATVNSAAEALAVMASDTVDLVFLDIRMPGLSGMDLARQLGNGPKIVFTTAYSDHAVEGFAVNALDYLLKPVSYEEFMRAAGRALAAVPGRTEEKAEPLPSSGFITVKSEYRLVRIPVAEIDYIEGLKDYVKIVLADGSRPVLTLMSMKSLEEMLPEASFMRVHRSFIVNMDKVRVIERNCVVMGRQLIPVSESARKRFFSALGMSQS